MPNFANWSFPTPIRFGPGRLRELADVCKAARISNALLVTDGPLSRLPITQNALDILKAGGIDCAIFDAVVQNPNEATLNAALRAFRDGNHDGVVAFGGGSCLDVGKLVGLLASGRQNVWDFTRPGRRFAPPIDSRAMPVIGVPTTAGTGSEVAEVSVLAEAGTGTKRIVFHFGYLPACVILDPELTLELSPSLTAGTGMDAFVHCLEAYCSPYFHPMCDGIALEGMRLCLDNLPKAYKDGQDIDARAAMMTAACMGAAAFQKGLGAIHALSHGIASVSDFHHGRTNAILIQPVLRLNRPAIEAKLNGVAAFLKVDGGFDGLVSHIGRFNQILDMPTKLDQHGIGAKAVDGIIEKALEDPNAAVNPVQLTRENLRTVLSEVL